MEFTLNTNNTTNENAKITLDEKAIVSLVQELVARDKAPINFSNAFEAVYNNMKQKAQERVQQYWDASQATTAPTATAKPVPANEVPKDIRDKAEEETKNEVKDGNNMEINISEIVAQAKKEAKAEAEVELTTRLIMFELGRMPKGELVKKAQYWMEVRDTSKIDRQTSIQVTKYCVESREAFDCEAATLNTLKAIGNEKFNEFLGIVKDVKWICE